MNLSKHTFGVSTLLVGAVIILLTAATFFLLTSEPDRSKVDMMAFWALIVSEFVCTIGIYLSVSQKLGASPIIMRVGIPTTLIIYFLLTLLLFAVKDLFEEHQNLFTVFHLFVIAPTIIIVIFISAFAGRVQAVDSQTKAAMAFMLETEKTLEALKNDAANAPFSQQLQAAYEAAKYADRVGKSSRDEEIFGAVEQLDRVLKGPDDTKADSVAEAVNKIKFLIAQRATELAQAKRGGF
ncbi:hypothetical protein GX645_01330 [Candidatus Sumerlaeota bacterium]|nr:hypothetical protein [Candidatus Sumerlaeota bacterium]